MELARAYSATKNIEDDLQLLPPMQLLLVFFVPVSSTAGPVSSACRTQPSSAKRLCARAGGSKRCVIPDISRQSFSIVSDTWRPKLMVSLEKRFTVSDEGSSFAGIVGAGVEFAPWEQLPSSGEVISKMEFSVSSLGLSQMVRMPGRAATTRL